MLCTGRKTKTSKQKYKATSPKEKALSLHVIISPKTNEVAIVEGVVLKIAMVDVVMVGLPMSRRSHMKSWAQ
jgi:hypothetical protein